MGREPRGAARRRTRGALQALAEVAQSLSHQLALEPLLKQITQAVAELMGSDNVTLWEADADSRRLARRVWVASPSIASGDLPASVGFDQGATGWIARQRLPLHVSDVTRDARILPTDLAGRGDLSVFAGVPLVVGDDLVGVLTLNLKRGTAITEEDQTLLAFFASQAAVAIHNASLFGEMTRRGDRLRKVAELARSVSSALELDDVLSQVAEAVLDLRPGLLCVIRLVDRDAGGYRLAGVRGPASGRREPVQPFGVGLTHAVAESRKPLLVTETLNEVRVAGSERAGPTIYYGLPLQASGELLGVLNVNFPAGEPPTADEREAISLFADQAAVAIRNANLFAASEARRRAAEALADVGGMLSRALDPEAVARLIVDRVCALFDARNAGLYELDAASGDLRALAISGDIGPGGGKPLVVPSGTLMLGLAVRERQPVSTPNLLTDPRLTIPPDARARLQAAPYRAVLALPLLRQNVVMGALAVGDRDGRKFTPEEIRLAQAFGDQAALALENARLYEQMRLRLRQVDSLRAVVEQILVPFSLDERLTLVARKAAELFDAERALVSLKSADGTLVVNAGHGLGEGEQGLVIQPGVGAVGVAAAQGEGILVNAYPAWPHARPGAVERPRPVQAIMAYPLFIRGEVFGVLSVASLVPGRLFGQGDLDRLATLAAPAALAIEHSRLYSELEARLTELRDTQAQLVQAGKLSAVGQLVSGVAHELNNPLSVVIGQGQLMLRRELPQEILRQLEVIVEQGERMARIVQGLLLFSRQRPPERAPMILREIVDQTLALRASELRVSGITAEVEHDPSLPPVQGDRHQLQQVFLNLLLNAEQAILGSGVGDRIRFRTRVQGTGAGLRAVADITDNGPGIPAEILPRIFDPFFTTKAVGTGTGLGLSLSYGIVEQHGGRIDVASRPGETTFAVSLPAMPTAVPGPTTRVVRRPKVVGHDRRALVVDDESAVGELVGRLLREMGFAVDVVPGGREGLERLRTTEYHLVVSDVRMPDVSGEEFYRSAVAGRPELARSFLMITGDTANRAAWKFLDETDLPSLAKPFTPDSFFQVVERLTVGDGGEC